MGMRCLWIYFIKIIYKGEKMERKECEKLLMKKLKEMQEIYKRYNPEGKYLAVCINEDFLSINNAYFAEDAAKPIDVSIFKNEN